MTEINFTSALHPVGYEEFNKITSKIGKENFVDFPWTIKESKMAKDTYTKDICDCTACLITDGQKSLLIHLNPASNGNHAFYNILMFLRNKLDLKDKNLQAVLIGSKNTKKSLDVYEKFKQLLTQTGMPFSELKNGKTPTNIAYRSDTDEVYINNQTISNALKKDLEPKKALLNSFEKILLSDRDEIN